MQTRKDKIEFKLFLSVWNQMQGQRTPNIHFRIAGWLERSWVNGDTHLLLQAFRSCGKSTIVGLFAAWLLYRAPETRILVLAAESTLARKMVRNVKRIIERHPLTEDLKPDRADQWGSDRFTIRRGRELRDPSMMAKGITSNITGARADVIICDDVEVPKTCDTVQKRQDLRERLEETAYILMPGGTQLYVGTPHSWYTIYAEEARQEIGEEEPFLAECKRLKVPLLNTQGQSVWPERFTKTDIAMMRRTSGPNKFKSQMMLEPVNIAEGYLDPNNIVFYDGALCKSDELKGLYLNGQRLVSCAAWWDPSFGKKGGDHSVLAIVYTDEEGTYFLHHLEYIRVDDYSSKDEATQQCEVIAQLAKRFHLPSVTVEINGIGRFLPAILRREMVKHKAACAVQEVSSTRPKDLRIMEAFDAILAAKALMVSEEIKQTLFINEMQEWRPGSSRGHDDGLDAVAGALSLQPVRLKRAYTQGRQTWQGIGVQHEARTDFNV